MKKYIYLEDLYELLKGNDYIADIIKKKLNTNTHLIRYEKEEGDQ